MIQNAKEEAGDSSGTSKPCDTQARTSTAKIPMPKVAVSKDGGKRPLSLSEGRLSLTIREKQTKTFEFQRCMLHRGRNHSHEDHVAARGFHSWHQNSSGHTYLWLPISRVMSKNCSGQRVGQVTKLPAWTTSKVKVQETKHKQANWQAQ